MKGHIKFTRELYLQVLLGFKLYTVRPIEGEISSRDADVLERSKGYVMVGDDGRCLIETNTQLEQTDIVVPYRPGIYLPVILPEAVPTGLELCPRSVLVMRISQLRKDEQTDYAKCYAGTNHAVEHDPWVFRYTFVDDLSSNCLVATLRAELQAALNAQTACHA